MKVEQRVQVSILGAYRNYSYSWYFDPTAGELPLQIGDKVELPPNQVQEEGSSGVVAAIGTSYKGELKGIVRLISRADDVSAAASESVWGQPSDAEKGDGDDLWAGFGEGDYS